MLKEGSVVIVTGKPDERIRESKGQTLSGTLQSLKGGKATVLLEDGNIWVGNEWEVYEVQGDDDARSLDLWEESD